ncbi:hypothetical protein O3G_MSEX014717 [Manduca sexta]|uniref:Uncharacterized protein n=1 Tax=Manduca sexta TaxID=7130 RepID=A0A922D0R0_MANSE|nr:hypothetical protein O3G_MSEX014717 [Manduca sexta]
MSNQIPRLCLQEDAITALVEELCGGAVSAALHFLEKELRRLKEERRQHAFILIALRDKAMREAAEAGRRQKEEHRRREHDEMFKQVLGVTQQTVDAYLLEVVEQGVELAAEEDALRYITIYTYKSGLPNLYAFPCLTVFLS